MSDKNASLRNHPLVMSILVRNEADIIAENIRFHSRQGVDAFIIGDNASTDGTREKVATLAKEIPIDIIDFPAGAYLQTQWRTIMARRALRKYDARWVISNDADEFWLPDTDNLKDGLSLYYPVMRVLRANMFQIKGRKQPFYQTPWRVSNTISYRSKLQRSLGQMSLSLVRIKPKIIVNPRGLRYVKGGNHHAWHWLFWRRPILCESIRIYHFALRSYEEFVENAQQKYKLLAKARFPMGAHDHRWAKMYTQGKLKEEYDNLTWSEEELHILQKLGFVVQDTRLAERFTQLGFSD